MIAVDSNVLVAAHRHDAPGHGSASAAVRTLAEDRSPWAIPAPCIHEFLAVVTHPSIFDPPSTMDDALAQVEAWRASPSVELISESGRHWESLASVLRQSRAVGPRVHDARIAAICIDHGARTILSADRDFARFPGIEARNPMAR